MELRGFTTGDEAVFYGIQLEGTWNGFAIPAFPFDEAMRIVAGNQRGIEIYGTDAYELVEYDADRDVFTVKWSGDDWVDIVEPVIVDGVRYYPIGGCSWTWSAVESDE